MKKYNMNIQDNTQPFLTDKVEQKDLLKLVPTSKTEFEVILKRYESAFLRSLLISLHKNFKNIINSTTNRTDYLKEKLTTSYYSNYYSKIVSEKPSSGKYPLNEVQIKENVILSILNVFYDLVTFKTDLEGKISLSDNDEIKLGISYEKKEFVVLPTNDIFYILHYWKSNSGLESNGNVNIAKLKIYSSWKDADLIYQSNSEKLSGKIIEDNSTANGKIYKLVFHENTERPISSVVSFFYPQDLEIQNHLWATFSRERKTRRGVIANGTAYLKRFKDESECQNYFEKPDELDNGIYAYLINNLVTLPKVTKNDKSGLGQLSSRLKQFEGIYKGYFIQPKGINESSLNQVIVVLKATGRVIIYTITSREFPESIYIGYFRIINKDNHKLLVIDFDYNKIENERLSHFTKYFNFRFVLFPEKDNWFTGTRIAVNNPHNYPTSTKIALHKLNSVEATTPKIDDFFSEESSQNSNTNTFLNQNLDNLLIRENDKLNSKIIDFFQKTENIFLKKFLMGEGEFYSYSDSNILQFIDNNLPKNHDQLAIYGEFECYSFTLRGNKPIFDYNIDEAVFLMYPLKIKENGNASIKVGLHIHDGRAYFNSEKKELMINFTKSIFLSGIFTLLEFEGNFYSERISGTLIKNTGVGGNPEGRVCVLIKKDNAFTNGINKKIVDIPFDSSNFIYIDKETNGVLSYLAGPGNRIARGVNDGKETDKFRTNSSFKNDMFYSACYLAQGGEINNDRVKKRLLQSYIHGFAQTFYKGVEVEKENNESFKRLQKEREQIIKAIENGPLNNEIIKNYVKELWFNEKSANKLHRIFGCEQGEETIIIKPNFREKNIAGSATMHAENDEYSIKVIKNIFSSSKLQVPKVLEHDANILHINQSKNVNYIFIGLFSNNFTKMINSLDAKQTKRYFFIEEDNLKELHKINIANTEKSRVVFEIDEWDNYQLEDSEFEDFFIIAKVDYEKNKAIICGGLKALGTEKAGDYLKEHWEKLYDFIDDETNFSISNGNNYVCFFGVLKLSNDIKLLKVRIE